MMSLIEIKIIRSVELGKTRNLKTMIVTKKGISTSQGDELGRSVRVPRVP